MQNSTADAAALEARWFGQRDFRCRLEWGWRGAKAAAARGDVLVIVDVLCFSTTVATAAAHGITIFPCAPNDDTTALAARVAAVTAVHRSDVPEGGQFSLSPATFRQPLDYKRVVLPSPNGAACTRLGRGAARVIVGALVNARAAAEEAVRAAEAANAAVTVLACGERWLTTSGEEGPLRFAVEDFIGAGAILAGLPDAWRRSPEACAAEAAYHGVSDDLEAALTACGSGIELIDKGFPDDVHSAAQHNIYSIAPVLIDGERFDFDV